MSYSGSINMSDLGNQHNNGPHQDQILLSGIVGQKLDLVPGGTDVPNRLFME